MRFFCSLLLLCLIPLALSGCTNPETDGNSSHGTEEGHDHEGHDHEGHDHSSHDHADHGNAEEAKMIEQAMAKLSDADRKLAQAQGICPVSEHALGTMGAPPKVDVDGNPVFICCEGCRDLLLENKDEMMAKLTKKAESDHGDGHSEQHPGS